MPEFLNKKFKSSKEMCSNLLNAKGVAILPGSDFGFPKEKMIARLSFTDFDGKKFMDNVSKDKIIDDNTINEFAPRVVEGVKKLKEWIDSK